MQRHTSCPAAQTYHGRASSAASTPSAQQLCSWCGPLRPPSTPQLHKRALPGASVHVPKKLRRWSREELSTQTSFSGTKPVQPELLDATELALGGAKAHRKLSGGAKGATDGVLDLSRRMGQLACRRKSRDRHPGSPFEPSPPPTLTPSRTQGRGGGFRVRLQGAASNDCGDATTARATMAPGLLCGRRKHRRDVRRGSISRRVARAA